jgi:hypothetical protein
LKFDASKEKAKGLDLFILALALGFSQRLAGKKSRHFACHLMVRRIEFANLKKIQNPEILRNVALFRICKLQF